MLQVLRIRNLALLEEVTLDLEPGFTAITGETGAGKSILLGALSLLAGMRADKSLIRRGAETCEVEALLYFSNNDGVDQLLSGLGLPVCEDGQLILKRSFSRTKAPRITVNGSLATLGNLQALGDLWIDFHGPGEPRRLLHPQVQLELLDLYGKITPKAAGYGSRYDRYVELLEERRRLASMERLSGEQMEFLQSRIEKIDAVAPSEEAVLQMEREYLRASGWQNLLSTMSRLNQHLDGEDGVTEKLASMVRLGRQLAEDDPETVSIAAQIEQLAELAAEIGRECQSYAETLEQEPPPLDELEERMNAWMSCKRVHGDSFAAVQAARERMSAQLRDQGGIEERLAEMDAVLADQLKALRVLAADLLIERKAAADRLCAEAGQLILKLGFQKAALAFSFRTMKDLSRIGDAQPELQFSANAGEETKPLAAVASSGELARVMLALKTVLAREDSTPVLVFDEVDANVGGEIGRVVGEQLALVARQHQVFCVTHLPQVAAQAAAHFVVRKESSTEETRVQILPIHGSSVERVEEIARMLGDRQSQSALSHARKLLM